MPRRAVSTRAILLGVVLIPLNCYWTAVMEIQWNSLDSTCVSLFFHVVFLLLVLTAINALVRRKFPAQALTQTELMTDYIMLSIASAVTLLLAAAKARFFWWPFHPIGYAPANSYALEYFWSAIMIGWFVKFLIVRYGGVKLYRSAIPFFLGLILGDYFIAAAWSLLGWILGINTYRTFIF